MKQAQVKPGTLVRLIGKRSTAYVVGPMENIKGGVILESPLDGFRYWNIADLEVVPKHETA